MQYCPVGLKYYMVLRLMDRSMKRENKTCLRNRILPYVQIDDCMKKMTAETDFVLLSEWLQNLMKAMITKTDTSEVIHELQF